MRLAIIASRSAAALAFVLSAAGAARAQKVQRGFVRVVVKDSTGTPITNAELTLRARVHDVLAHGTTDDNGRGVLSFDVKDSTDFQVTMRKIGYSRADHFFVGAPRDTSSVTITVAPAGTSTLAPVRVTADADLRRKSYYLSADDIEKSDLELDNAWEVVKRMRPDMLTSRGGCATGIQEVWVNGEHIRLPLRPTGMAAARARVGVPARARFSYVPVSVMSDILPEHIQEIVYHDCFDATMARVGTVNAMFVTLKPGVEYVKNVGSMVIEKAASTSDKR